jgi:hypothetical protein
MRPASGAVDVAGYSRISLIGIDGGELTVSVAWFSCDLPAFVFSAGELRKWEER